MASLLYDPDCGFCTRSAAWLLRLGVRCAVVPMTPQRLAAHGIDAVRAGREVPFVADDGAVRFGAPAIAAALRTAPLPAAALGWLVAAPGVRRLAAPVYAWVAAHRHQLPGGTGSCRLPG